MDTTLAKLLAIQGRRVAIVLKDGGRIDECTVVALPVHVAAKFWVATGARDIVISAAQVAEVWEVNAEVARATSTERTSAAPAGPFA